MTQSNTNFLTGLVDFFKPKPKTIINAYKPSTNTVKGFVEGTNIQLHGNGKFTDYGASRSSTSTGNVSDLNLDGKTILLEDGTSMKVGDSGMSWQDGLGLAAQGLQSLSGLYNAYTGYKNYQLAKKQFAFEKAAMNRNIANQAKIINNTYDNAANIAADMFGNRDAQGMLSQEVKDKFAAHARSQHVDGSKIG